MRYPIEEIVNVRLEIVMKGVDLMGEGVCWR